MSVVVGCKSSLSRIVFRVPQQVPPAPARSQVIRSHLAILLLLFPWPALRVAAPETVRYRLDIENVATFLDDDGITSDTSITVAFLTATLSDSNGSMLASIRVDSGQIRGARERVSMSGLKSEPAVAGITSRILIAPGYPPRMLSLTLLKDQETTSALRELGETFLELFPLFKTEWKAGDHGRDSTSLFRRQSITRWAVTGGKNGTFDLSGADSTTIAADVPGEGSFRSAVATLRTVTTTRLGPVISATIKRTDRAQMDDPGEGLTVNIVRDRTTRITRIP